MGESTCRRAALLILAFAIFLLDCAPVTPSTDPSEKKVFLLEPLLRGNKSKRSGNTWGFPGSVGFKNPSKKFAPKNFSFYPAVPLQTFSDTVVAQTQEHVDKIGGEAGVELVEPVMMSDVGKKRVHRIPEIQLEDVNHSPVVANVVESLKQTINKIEVNQLSTEVFYFFLFYLNGGGEEDLQRNHLRGLEAGSGERWCRAAWWEWARA